MSFQETIKLALKNIILKLRFYEHFMFFIQSSEEWNPKESFIWLMYKVYCLLSDSIIYISFHSKIRNNQCENKSFQRSYLVVPC